MRRGSLLATVACVLGVSPGARPLCGFGLFAEPGRGCLGMVGGLGQFAAPAGVFTTRLGRAIAVLWAGPTETA
eukprot:7271053-Alexandrium_andersonii.AAC.1